MLSHMEPCESLVQVKWQWKNLLRILGELSGVQPALTKPNCVLIIHQCSWDVAQWQNICIAGMRLRFHAHHRK